MGTGGFEAYNSAKRDHWPLVQQTI